MQAEVNQFSAYIFKVNIKYIAVFVADLSWFKIIYNKDFTIVHRELVNRVSIFLLISKILLTFQSNFNTTC